MYADVELMAHSGHVQPDNEKGGKKAKDVYFMKREVVR